MASRDWPWSDPPNFKTDLRHFVQLRSEKKLSKSVNDFPSYRAVSATDEP